MPSDKWDLSSLLPFSTQRWVVKKTNPYLRSQKRQRHGGKGDGERRLESSAVRNTEMIFRVDYVPNCFWRKGQLRNVANGSDIKPARIWGSSMTWTIGMAVNKLSIPSALLILQIEVRRAVCGLARHGEEDRGWGAAAHPLLGRHRHCSHDLKLAEHVDPRVYIGMCSTVVRMEVEELRDPTSHCWTISYW